MDNNGCGGYGSSTLAGAQEGRRFYLCCQCWESLSRQKAIDRLALTSSSLSWLATALGFMDDMPSDGNGSIGPCFFGDLLGSLLSRGDRYSVLTVWWRGAHSGQVTAGDPFATSMALSADAPPFQPYSSWVLAPAAPRTRGVRRTASSSSSRSLFRILRLRSSSATRRRAFVS